MRPASRKPRSPSGASHQAQRTAAPPGTAAGGEDAALPLLFTAILESSEKRTSVGALAGSTWVLGALVFLLTWGGGAAAPGPYSLDVSTHAGLAMAATSGLDHGSDIVFSYGPLGFLKSYLTFYVWPARLALLYGVALHLALCLSLVWAARRSFPLLVALPLALVAAMLLRGDLSAIGARMDAAVVVLAFIWCVAALDPRSPEWARRIVVYGGGPFGALELLAKLNTGVVVLALVAVTIAVVEPRRLRDAAVSACGFGATLAVLWLVTGQGVGDVGPFVSGVRDIVSGYSASAYLDYGTRDYDYYLAAIVIAVVGALAWTGTREFARPRRVATLAMFAIVAYASFKAGFVSHEVHHMTIFYSTMAGIAFAFRVPRGAVAAVPATVAVAGLCGVALTANFPGYPMANPLTNLRDAAITAETFAIPGRLEDRITESRTAVAGAYGLDPRAVELLGQGGVHVEPTETIAAWALGVDWSPLPVFQSYAAWSPELDERNAEALADPDGPDRILRQATNPLNRYPAFESPAANVAMLCNFEPLWNGSGWQVLGRVRDRCGEERPLQTVDARVGDAIPLPEAPSGELLVAHVEGLEPAGLERAVAAVYRADWRSVVFDSGIAHFVTAATAEDGLLLRVPADADYPAPFNLSPESATVTFTRGGDATGEELTIEFATVPIAPSRDAGPGDQAG